MSFLRVFFNISFFLCISALTYTMEKSGVRLTMDEIDVFKDIITQHKRVGSVAPFVRQLYTTNLRWQEILSEKRCCKNLLNMFDALSNIPKTAQEVSAAFFGTPGTIEYAKDLIKEV